MYIHLNTFYMRLNLFIYILMCFVPIWANPIWAKPIWAKPMWAKPIWAKPVWAWPIWALAHMGPGPGLGRARALRQGGLDEKD